MVNVVNGLYARIERLKRIVKTKCQQAKPITSLRPAFKRRATKTKPAPSRLGNTSP
jgi:hypothetical protein